MYVGVEIVYEMVAMRQIVHKWVAEIRLQPLSSTEVLSPRDRRCIRLWCLGNCRFAVSVPFRPTFRNEVRVGSGLKAKGVTNGRLVDMIA